MCFQVYRILELLLLYNRARTGTQSKHLDKIKAELLRSHRHGLYPRKCACLWAPHSVPGPFHSALERRQTRGHRLGEPINSCHHNRVRYSTWIFNRPVGLRLLPSLVDVRRIIFSMNSLEFLLSYYRNCFFVFVFFFSTYSTSSIDGSVRGSRG